MAVNERKILTFLKGWLQGRGGIEHVTVGEPMSAPVDHIHGSIQFRAIEVTGTNLRYVEEEWRIALLVYWNAITQEPEDTEFAVIAMARLLFNDLNSDMNLNDQDNIRSIAPVNTQVNSGFLQIQNKWFRTLEILVGVLVDDSTEMT